MTNGEKIKEIFPNLEISPNPYSPSVDIYIGGIMMMRVDRNWWNAEYKVPTTKNNLVVDCISRADLYNRIKKIDHDEDYECDEFGGSRITYHICDWDEVLREIEDAPSVTPQEPIIDKIRAEIIEKDRNVKAVRNDRCCFFTVDEVLAILDKYKAESEGKK